MSRTATRHDLLLLTAIGLVVLLASFGIRWALVDDASSWDVPLYESFGDRIADGERPYADIRIEYPPGALPAFVLPALASRALGPAGASVYEPTLNGPARSYALWFALLMVLCLAVTLVASAVSLGALGATLGHATAALLVVGLTPILLGEVSLTRFDALPVALTAVAATLLLRDRPTGAGVVLGLAIAVKLYPLLLLPLFALYVARHRGRAAALVATAASLVTAAAVFIPFLVAAPSEAFFPLRAQLARGLQVESLPGSIVLAVDGFLERAVSRSIVSIDEGGTGAVRSADVVGSPGAAVALLSVLMGVALTVWVWTRWTRAPFAPATLVAACAAVLAAQLAFGRVLSPQFVLWVLPFVPLVAGRSGRIATALLVAAFLVTHAWFPQLYREFVNGQDPQATIVLLTRNAILVALVATLVVPALRGSRTTVSPTGTP